MKKTISTLFIFLLMGCSGSSGNSDSKNKTSASLTSEQFTEFLKSPELINAGEFSPEKMLLNLSLNVYLQRAKDFKVKTERLVEKTQAYCLSIDSDSENLGKTQAQEAWQQAMQSYHKISSSLFGPIIDNARFLADNIYSWPVTNTCGIEGEMIAYKENKKLNPKALFTVKGLTAIEFGLFSDLETTSCDSRNKNFKAINEWTQLEIPEKSKDTCLFALDHAKETALLADQLFKKWDPNSENFTLSLFQGNESINQIVNKISDSLFSIEKTKDRRLGRPLGLHNDCTNESGVCVQDIEHKWSHFSFDAIESEIKGLRQIFSGEYDPDENKKSFGFDDYLISVRKNELSDQILNQMDLILKLIDDTKKEEVSFTKQLENQINKNLKQDQSPSVGICKRTLGLDQSERPSVCNLQSEIRNLALLFKNDFLIALSLVAPPTFQGDAD